MIPLAGPKKKGWVKFMRSFEDTKAYVNANAALAYTHCLLRANIENTTVKGHPLQRGQFITSVARLAEECRLSYKEMRHAMDMLEADGLIIREPAPNGASNGANNRASNGARNGAKNGTLVTVVNYGFENNQTDVQGEQWGEKQGKVQGEQPGNSIRIRKENKNNNGGGNTIQYSVELSDAFITTTTRILKDIPDYIYSLVERYGEEIVTKAIGNADRYSTPTSDKRNGAYISKACEGIAAGRDDRVDGDDIIFIRDESIEDWS